MASRTSSISSFLRTLMAWGMLVCVLVVPRASQALELPTALLFTHVQGICQDWNTSSRTLTMSLSLWQSSSDSLAQSSPCEASEQQEDGICQNEERQLEDDVLEHGEDLTGFHDLFASIDLAELPLEPGEDVTCTGSDPDTCESLPPPPTPLTLEGMAQGHQVHFAFWLPYTRADDSLESRAWAPLRVGPSVEKRDRIERPPALG